MTTNEPDPPPLPPNWADPGYLTREAAEQRTHHILAAVARFDRDLASIGLGIDGFAGTINGQFDGGTFDHGNCPECDEAACQGHDAECSGGRAWATYADDGTRQVPDPTGPLIDFEEIDEPAPAAAPTTPTEPGQELEDTPGDPMRLGEQPTPGEASAPDNPHGDHGMYELTIRIPMTTFTRTAPNEDPRVDQLIDHAMDLFPAADAAGGLAWPEDGPGQCPTCGAVDRHERRHRAHVDAETTLRELVRWLTTETQRLRDAGLTSTHVNGNLDLARSTATRRVLDRLRDQGLDVDYLAQPDTREQT